MLCSPLWCIFDLIVAFTGAIIVLIVVLGQALVNMGEFWSWKVEWRLLKIEYQALRNEDISAFSSVVNMYISLISLKKTRGLTT
jgi:hypothetical protein